MMNGKSIKSVATISHCLLVIHTYVCISKVFYFLLLLLYIKISQIILVNEVHLTFEASLGPLSVNCKRLITAIAFML